MNLRFVAVLIALSAFVAPLGARGQSAPVVDWPGVLTAEGDPRITVVCFRNVIRVGGAD